MSAACPLVRDTRRNINKYEILRENKWRRRESNPGPEVFHATVYVRIRMISTPFGSPTRQGAPAPVDFVLSHTLPTRMWNQPTCM